jgi:hypothetical protein
VFGDGVLTGYGLVGVLPDQSEGQVTSALFDSLNRDAFVLLNTSFRSGEPNSDVVVIIVDRKARRFNF